MKRVGTLLGFPVYEDPEIDPEEIVLGTYDVVDGKLVVRPPEAGDPAKEACAEEENPCD